MTRGQKLYRACMTFEDSKYTPVVRQMTEAYSRKEYKKFDKLHESLPTNLELLDKILERVKGKKVFRTLKRTVNETIEDSTESLVGLSSLLTHVAIECRENREYRALLPDLYGKLGALIVKI